MSRAEISGEFLRAPSALQPCGLAFLKHISCVGAGLAESCPCSKKKKRRNSENEGERGEKESRNIIYFLQISTRDGVLILFQ